MALTSDADRKKIMGVLSRSETWGGLTKPDIQAAVNAIDDWLEANAATMNQALPQPFRNNATAAQKLTLFAYVCMKRANKLTND